VTEPTVVVLDYGSGNLRSVTRALAAVGAKVILTSDTAAARQAAGLVVPGVGAFATCLTGLRAAGAPEVIARRVAHGQPVLGICVGHQALFASGTEHGLTTAGLGLLPGTIDLLPTTRRPHMGWNALQADAEVAFWSATPNVGQRYYFVHSYAALDAADLPAGARVALTEHDGVTMIAGVEWGPLLSTQFHPEKSGRAGLALLAHWVATL